MTYPSAPKLGPGNQNKTGFSFVVIRKILSGFKPAPRLGLEKPIYTHIGFALVITALAQDRTSFSTKRQYKSITEA